MADFTTSMDDKALLQARYHHGWNPGLTMEELDAAIQRRYKAGNIFWREYFDHYVPPLIPDAMVRRKDAARPPALDGKTMDGILLNSTLQARQDEGADHTMFILAAVVVGLYLYSRSR